MVIAGELDIVEAWRKFTIHARECVACGVAEHSVIQVMSVDHGRAYSKEGLRGTFAEACEEGQGLLWAWDMACQDALEGAGRTSRRLEVWGDGPDLEDRREALMALPEREFKHVLAMEPEPARMAAVGALTLAYRRTRNVVVPVQGGGEERLARPGYCSCGHKIKNPAHKVCYECWIQGKGG